MNQTQEALKWFNKATPEKQKKCLEVLFEYAFENEYLRVFEDEEPYFIESGDPVTS